ncbi:C40 family peptidase [Kitasatospora mediocidica]|uniref:C40 family peptidase n=1 Tax=Kitasatospora mediocidica TaxID=58352 RepID=UPI000568F081|nr:C40 family peptidase [Kitasatospora mediocidica]
MGNHRKPNPPGRLRAAALTTAAAGSVLLTTATGAHADPAPTVESVKAQVDQLNTQAEVSTEKFNGLKARQQQLQTDAAQLQDRVAAGQERMNQLRTRLGAVAGNQYRSGGIDPSLQLMLNSDPGSYLAQAAAQNQAADGTAALLKQVQAEQRRLDQDRVQAAATLAELGTSTTAMGNEKKDVQDRLAQAQALLNKLSAADRAKLAAQDAGPGGSGSGSGSGSGADARAARSADRPTYQGPATGRAAAAVQFAYAQLGKPYEWGATGPSTFDCSGLTGAAWSAAGVSLPRVSQDQWNAGHRVARADLQPGDLVFFFSDLHHVGIYIGNGQMIHAPRTGKNVTILNLDSMPSYMGAVRP